MAYSGGNLGQLFAFVLGPIVIADSADNVIWLLLLELVTSLALLLFCCIHLPPPSTSRVLGGTHQPHFLCGTVEASTASVLDCTRPDAEFTGVYNPPESGDRSNFARFAARQSETVHHQGLESSRVIVFGTESSTVDEPRRESWRWYGPCLRGHATSFALHARRLDNELRLAARSRPMLVLSLLAGIEAGVSAGWAGLISQTLVPPLFSSRIAGIAGVSNSVTCLAGNVFGGILADTTFFSTRLPELLVLVLLLSSVSFGGYAVSAPSVLSAAPLLPPAGGASAVILAAAAGFFQGSADPVLYELAADVLRQSADAAHTTTAAARVPLREASRLVGAGSADVQGEETSGHPATTSNAFRELAHHHSVSLALVDNVGALPSVWPPLGEEQRADRVTEAACRAFPSVRVVAPGTMLGSWHQSSAPASGSAAAPVSAAFVTFMYNAAALALIAIAPLLQGAESVNAATTLIFAACAFGVFVGVGRSPRIAEMQGQQQRAVF